MDSSGGGQASAGSHGRPERIALKERSYHKDGKSKRK